ncbi:MAG TPA: hypothetical protein VGE23_01395 [Candidatus Paceibacterota bacterium]
MAKKPIPRWQQGFRSLAYRDVQERMTPEERRVDFCIDMAVVAAVVIGAGIMTWLGRIPVDVFWGLVGFIAIVLIFLFSGNRDPFPDPPEE